MRKTFDNIKMKNYGSSGVLGICGIFRPTDIEINRLKPNEGETESIDKTKQFLDKFDLGVEESAMELVYIAEDNELTFRTVYPSNYDKDITTGLDGQFQSKLRKRSRPEKIFTNAQREDTSVGAVEFELTKDHLYPLATHKKNDPLSIILDKMDQGTGSDVDMMYQVTFKRIKNLPSRASLRSGIKSYREATNIYKALVNIPKGLFDYQAKDKKEALGNSGVNKKFNNDLYEVDISLIAVCEDEAELKDQLSYVASEIEEEFERNEQKLEARPAKTEAHLNNIIKRAAARDIKKNRKSFFRDKSSLRKPTIIQKDILAELIHLPQGDLKKASLDVEKTSRDLGTTRDPDV